MSIGDSPTSICNSALVALGQDPIASLQEQSKRAILCNLRYDPVRRHVLRSTQWNCAKALASLNASATPPAFGWGNSFPLPADFLRLWDLDDDADVGLNAGSNDTTAWEVIGNAIMTNDGGPLNIYYVRDLQDTTVMDSLLVETIARALAEDLAIPLTQDDAKQQRAAQRLEDKMEDARLATSQENSVQQFDDDVWLRARRMS